MEDWLQGAHCLYQTSAAKHFKFLLLGSSLLPDVSLFLGLRLVTFPSLFFSRVFFFFCFKKSLIHLTPHVWTMHMTGSLCFIASEGEEMIALDQSNHGRASYRMLALKSP